MRPRSDQGPDILLGRECAEALAIDAVRAAYVRVLTEQRETLAGLLRDVLEDADRAPSIAAGILAAIEGAFRLAAIDRSLIPEGSAAGTVRAMARALVES